MAGLIPQSFIDELLNRVDIVEVIDRRVTLKKAGKNYQACCPFHQEKTPSFSVQPERSSSIASAAAPAAMPSVSS